MKNSKFQTNFWSFDYIFYIRMGGTNGRKNFKG